MKKNETPKPKAPTPPVKKAKKPVILLPTIEQNEDVIQEDEVNVEKPLYKEMEQFVGKYWEDRGNGVLEQTENNTVSEVRDEIKKRGNHGHGTKRK